MARKYYVHGGWDLVHETNVYGEEIMLDVTVYNGARIIRLLYIHRSSCSSHHQDVHTTLLL